MHKLPVDGVPVRARGPQIRLNDERAATGEQIVERKSVVSDIKDKDDDHTGLTARSVTSSCVLPMKLNTLYDAQPFYIAECSVLLELTSIVTDVLPDKGKEGSPDGKYEFRPDLVCHDTDLRNLVSVRDYDSTLDGMSSFDIINSSPTVEVRGKGSSAVLSSPIIATHTHPHASRFVVARAVPNRVEGREAGEERRAGQAGGRVHAQDEDHILPLEGPARALHEHRHADHVLRDCQLVELRVLLQPRGQARLRRKRADARAHARFLDPDDLGREHDDEKRVRYERTHHLHNANPRLETV